MWSRNEERAKAKKRVHITAKVKGIKGKRKER